MPSLERDVPPFWWPPTKGSEERNIISVPAVQFIEFSYHQRLFFHCVIEFCSVGKKSNSVVIKMKGDAFLKYMVGKNLDQQMSLSKT